VEEIFVVVGHCADQVEAEIARIPTPVPVRMIANPDYHLGSALSLLKAAPAYEGSPSLIMDADLLVEASLFTALVSHPKPNCLLVDERLSDSGEEVKIVGDSSGRVMELAKKISRPGTIIGESLGIFKFSAEAGRLIAGALRSAAQTNLDIEYEPVFSGLLPEIDTAYQSVGGLPWIEIDLPEDLARARKEIWQLIEEKERSEHQGKADHQVR